MKKNKYTYKNSFSDAIFMLKFVWNCSKSLFVLKLIEIIIYAFAVVANSFSLKIIIDSIIYGKDFSQVAIEIIIIQIIIQIIYTLETVIVNITIPKFEYKIKNNLQNIFIQKSVKVGLENYEDSKFYDDYTKAMKIADSKALAYVDYIKDVVSAIINIILMGFIITYINAYIYIFIVVIVILTIIDQKISIKYSSILYESEESINRKMNYIKNIAHDRKYAKEVRTFNFGNFLINKHNTAFDEKFKIYKNINNKYWIFKYVISFFRNFLLVIGLLIYISYLVIFQEISIGDFTLIFGSIFSFARYISDITNSLEQIKFQGEYYVSHLKIIYNLKSDIEDNNDDKEHIQNKASHYICFNNVYFKYPKHDEWVLDNVSFKINPGEKIAIVGKNGAGKSTIIKLLLRLYDVTDGEILIDGINIKNINVIDLRKTFSVIFQDFNIYSFTIAENIMMNLYDDSKKKEIDNALQLFDLKEYFNKYGDPKDIYLNREFDENGVVLSGGLMQQLAIARAIYSDGTIALFDEPNSSLDPIAEYNLNKTIISNINSKSAIFVTHRLSTAVMADKIFLLDKGKIVEVGSHTELLSKKGLYYEMFEKQNTIYRILKELDE